MEPDTSWFSRDDYTRLKESTYAINVCGPQKQYDTHNEHFDCDCKECQRHRLKFVNH